MTTLDMTVKPQHKQTSNMPSNTYAKCVDSHHPVHALSIIWAFALQGPVVQSVVSLMSLLRVISFIVLADSIYNILIFFAEKR